MLSDQRETVDLGRKIGEKLFGIGVDVVEEENPDAMGPALYDFGHGRVSLCPSFIKRLCDERSDSRAVIVYAICHEIGHASETRLFAKGLLFPYGLKISNKLSIFVRSRFGVSLFQQDLKLAMAQVLNGVLDYCVDRRLHANGMKDVTQKNIVSQVKSELEKRESGNYKVGLDNFNALSNLPLRVVSYCFGDLSSAEREILEKYYRHGGLADKWRTGRQILESCEFGNPNRFVETIERTYYEMFGINVSVQSRRRELIEAQYVGGNLPSFWNAEEYFLFLLN